MNLEARQDAIREDFVDGYLSCAQFGFEVAFTQAWKF